MLFLGTFGVAGGWFCFGIYVAGFYYRGICWYLVRGFVFCGSRVDNARSFSLRRFFGVNVYSFRRVRGCRLWY